MTSLRDETVPSFPRSKTGCHAQRTSYLRCRQSHLIYVLARRVRKYTFETYVLPITEANVASNHFNKLRELKQREMEGLYQELDTLVEQLGRLRTARAAEPDPLVSLKVPEAARQD